jgi:hypothetical protein
MPETSENESLMASHPGTYLLHAYSSMFLPLGTHKALVPVLDDVPKHGFDGMLGMDVQKDSENPIVLLAPKFCQHGKGEEGKEAKTKNAQNNEKGDTSATEEKSNDWETVEKAEASGTAESYGDGGGEDGWVEIRSGIC